MEIEQLINPIRPGTKYVDNDKSTTYWIKDGKVYYWIHAVKGADANTFFSYLNGFAADKKHCYYMGHRLADGHGEMFRALNYTYMTDGRYVWTVAGRVKDVDAESFEVCDHGFIILSRETHIPHSYGKDKYRVYYYDFDGITNWVRKADPKTFISLNDGHFGHDENFVFCGRSALPKAVVSQWRKLGGYYSTDGRRMYYFNRIIKDADCVTFEVVQGKRSCIQLAKDSKHYFHNDSIVSAEAFVSLLEE
jgi:hypothetical protein